ncbi:MAG: hypothetical protein HQL23_06625 [Candidatus Omnitrophica bacterium]|nr:hypothetical protein [Candidatus Omnitrophota bacterium]
MKSRSRLMFLLVSAVFYGCSYIVQPVKTILGTSTYALEKKRSTAEVKRFQCSFDDCFDAVIALGATAKTKPLPSDAKKSVDPSEEKAKEINLNIFSQNRIKGLIVFVGLPGHIDTTEAGVFFREESPTVVRLEIVSLAESAQETAANLVFSALHKKFLEVK